MNGLSVGPGASVSTAPAIATMPEGPPQQETAQAMSAGVIFSDGFEGSAKWTVEGSPTWGVTTYRAASGSRSAYCAGSAVSAPGPYLNNMDARMVAGPFDLSSAGSGSLDFDLYLDTERGYDYCSYLISTDGDNFYGAGWSGLNGNSHVSVDLTHVSDGSGGYRSVCGRSRVWIMFRFTSDSANVYEGAYVDNVVLSVGGGQSQPTITGISPSSASAGTGTTVTISGSGFGASQGSGYVSFYHDGSYIIKPAIASWSDTRILCNVPTALIDGQAASAGSGPVQVIDSSGQASSGYPFTVTFGFGGYRWSGTSCSYLINANTSNAQAAAAMVQAAAATWSSASAFKFGYRGISAATSSTPNGTNDIFWSNSLLASGLIAVSFTWRVGNTFTEADICFNGNYRWGDGSGGTMDVQSIALHEFGHWLQLLDLYGDDSDKVMYGNSNYGIVKRTLSPDDAAGARWIYGGSSATTTTLPPTTTTTLPPTTTTTLPPTTTTLSSTTTTNPSGTTTTTQPQAGFPDVPANNPYHDAILYLAGRRIVQGYPDGNFGPGDLVTRQQFAKMIDLALSLPVTLADICPFSDVETSAGSDLFPDHYVAVAAARGITKGTGPGLFSPGLAIFRAQVVTMIVRGAGSVDPGILAEPPKDWTGTLGDFDPTHGPTLRRAEYNGLLDGLVGFGPAWNPWALATRGEVAQMLWRLILRAG